MVRRLQPWHANRGKRHVKAPKVYVRDAACCTRSYFCAAHTGVELDLLLMKGSGRYGVEVKFQDAPRVTPSMRNALRLHHLTVLYPGDLRYTLDRHMTVVPLADLASDPGAITPTTRGRRP
jgi:predicted AAA+ superfamily ATPase